MKFAKAILRLFSKKNILDNTQEHKVNEIVHEIVKCNRPNCDGIMVRRKMNFYSCSEYPDCDHSVAVENFDKYRQENYSLRKYLTKQHLYPNEYIVLDFETTGLNPRLDRIIEVAAIKYQYEREVGRFSSLVKFHGTLPEVISNLTGLTDEDLENQPDEAIVITQLREFIGNVRLIAAHNAKFDMLFLGYGLKRHNIPSWTVDVLCTYRISRLLYPLAENGIDAAQHKLPVMCRRLNIPFEESHRAVNDALACGELMKKLWSTMNSHGLEQPYLPVVDLVRDRRYKMSYGVVNLNGVGAKS